MGENFKFGYVAVPELNAGLPINSSFPRDMVPNGIETLKRVFAKCQEDLACQTAYGNIEDQLLNLLESLDKDPVIIPLKHPETGEDINYVPNGHRFGAYIFISMYATPQVPYLIKRVSKCYLFRFDSISHSIIDSAPECSVPMVLEFLNDPSQAPDSSCMQNYKLKLITNDEQND